MIYKAKDSGSPIIKGAFLVNRYAGLVGFTLNLAYMFCVVPYSICRKVRATLDRVPEGLQDGSTMCLSLRLHSLSDTLDTRCSLHDDGERR